MKKALRRTIAMLLVTGILLAMAACNGGTNPTPTSSQSAASPSPTPAATYVMKIANQWGEASVHSRMFTEVFIPRIEELSGGRITCEFYGNNAVGNEMDQLSQLQMGALHMAIISDQSASLDPGRMLLPFLPFLFENEEHWDNVFGGELGQELVKNLPAQGVRVLGFDENGYRQITNNVHPINKPEDIKDLKLRVTSSDMYIAIFSALGASCQAMTLGEVYSALETGACDGQDNAYNTILTANFQEVQKYLTNTYHVLGTMYVSVSEKWYQDLPEDLQELVAQVTAEACEWQHKTYREQAEKDHQALLDAGMEETYPDLAPFREVTAGVYKDFVAKYPDVADLVAKIQAAVE